MCSDNVGADGEANGECPDCGEATVDGEAKNVCAWSGDEPCETCGYASCYLGC
jgi:hypothetical protein